jgi:NADH dehydrogenase
VSSKGRSLAVVTGAFSYTGGFIARRLLDEGVGVRTLSRREDPSSPLHGRVEVAALQFRDEPALVESLRGAQALYNTYWIRYERGGSTFARAVENTRTLFRAARAAGVERVVHISVSNPSEDSPLPYFRGKAACERALAESGLVHAIVRPTLIFGQHDLLVNNIAWILRRFPVFLVPGSGRYRLQPVSAENVAELAVSLGHASRVPGSDPGTRPHAPGPRVRPSDPATVDAAGPEVYTFDDVVRAIGSAIGRPRRLVHLPVSAALALGAVGARVRRDVLLTRDEVAGLEADLLVSHGPALGGDDFRQWLAANGDQLGRTYVSELARNFRPYAAL